MSRKNRVARYVFVSQKLAAGGCDLARIRGASTRLPFLDQSPGLKP